MWISPADGLIHFLVLLPRQSLVIPPGSPPSSNPDLLGSAKTHMYPWISSGRFVSFRSPSSSMDVYLTSCDLGRSSLRDVPCGSVSFVVDSFSPLTVFSPPFFFLVVSRKVLVHPLHSLLWAKETHCTTADRQEFTVVVLSNFTVVHLGQHQLALDHSTRQLPRKDRRLKFRALTFEKSTGQSKRNHRSDAL
jgi:hypothetical protein